MTSFRSRCDLVGKSFGKRDEGQLLRAKVRARVSPADSRDAARLDVVEGTTKLGLDEESFCDPIFYYFDILGLFVATSIPFTSPPLLYFFPTILTFLIHNHYARYSRSRLPMGRRRKG